MELKYNLTKSTLMKIMASEKLPEQMLSEINIFFSKLGVEMPVDESSSANESEETISPIDFISSFSISSSATFEVKSEEECDVKKFCRDKCGLNNLLAFYNLHSFRMLRSICPFGFGQCKVIASKEESTVFCKIKVRQGFSLELLIS